MTQVIADTADPAPTHFSWVSRGVLLVGLGLLAYHNAFDGPFLFDDWSSIVDSQLLQSVWPLEPYFAANRPLVTYSFAINRALGGLDVRGYHAVNIAIHIFNALLLAATIWAFCHQPYWQRLIPKYAAQQLSFVTAALWLVHPLATQSVTYITQRYESAMALCLLGCVWSSLRSWTSKQPVFWLTFSMVCCWAGFLCKEVMIVVPVLIPLFDRAATGDSWRALWKRRRWFYLCLWTPWLMSYRTFVATAFAGPAPGHVPSAGFAYRQISPWQYLATQPEILWHYLRLSAWPDRLCIDYGWPVQNAFWITAVCGVPILVISIICVVAAIRGSTAGLLMTVFLIVLAPTSSIVPIADLANEHRMYVPLMCLVTGTVFLGYRLLMLTVDRHVMPLHTAVALGMLMTLAAITGLTLRTIDRNRDYTSPLRIWAAAVRVNPLNSRAWYNVGSEYLDAGQLELAAQHFREGLKCPRPLPAIYHGLGECLRRQGDFEAAEQAFRRVLEVDANHPPSRLSLGVVLQMQGRLEPALKEYEQAAASGSIEAAYNAASLKFEMGRHAEAVEELRRLVERHPDFLPARLRLSGVQEKPRDQE